MKLAMTGLDYRRSSLEIREQFAVTNEKAKRVLAEFKNSGIVSGNVIVSTCNRTELYVSVKAGKDLSPSIELCKALGVDISKYQPYLTERTGTSVMEHLCRVASGLDSQVTGDSQVITQVREALELSRALGCTDGYIETMFNLSIHAAKAIKTKALSGSLGESSVPEKTVEELKKRGSLAGKNALVIGSGTIGRLVTRRLIQEGARVTITLRSHQHKQKNSEKSVTIPPQADTISYNERYRALENANIVISATASPHLTLLYSEMSALTKLPALIVDLAVPRDVEAAIQNLPGVNLLTIDDISGDARLSPESAALIGKIIDEHITQYRQWVEYKEKMAKM